MKVKLSVICVLALGALIAVALAGGRSVATVVYAPETPDSNKATCTVADARVNKTLVVVNGVSQTRITGSGNNTCTGKLNTVANMEWNGCVEQLVAGSFVPTRCQEGSGNPQTPFVKQQNAQTDFVCTLNGETHTWRYVYNVTVTYTDGTPAQYDSRTSTEQTYSNCGPTAAEPGVALAAPDAPDYQPSGVYTPAFRPVCQLKDAGLGKFDFTVPSIAGIPEHTVSLVMGGGANRCRGKVAVLGIYGCLQVYHLGTFVNVECAAKQRYDTAYMNFTLTAPCGDYTTYQQTWRFQYHGWVTYYDLTTFSSQAVGVVKTVEVDLPCLGP